MDDLERGDGRGPVLLGQLVVGEPGLAVERRQPRDRGRVGVDRLEHAERELGRRLRRSPGGARVRRPGSRTGSRPRRWRCAAYRSAAGRAGRRRRRRSPGPAPRAAPRTSKSTSSGGASRRSRARQLGGRPPGRLVGARTAGRPSSSTMITMATPLSTVLCPGVRCSARRARPGRPGRWSPTPGRRRWGPHAVRSGPRRGGRRSGPIADAQATRRVMSRTPPTTATRADADARLAPMRRNLLRRRPGGQRSGENGSVPGTRRSPAMPECRCA